MNDLRRAYLADAADIDTAVSRVVQSGWYALGPEVEAFEAEFAQYCGVDRAIGLGNGTDALELSLRAIGVQTGDQVIVAPNAGGYSTTAIRAIGAIPVYADIDPVTLSIDPKRVAELLADADTSHNKVKCIIVTHLFGILGDVKALRAIADQAGVMLLEDGAQAHGASFGGVRAGAFGDIAAFSFYPSKNLGAIGDAGAVVTSNEQLAQRVRELRQYGWGAKYRVEHAGGGNSRLDPIQAAALRVRLSRLDQRNDRRRELVERYAQELEPMGIRVVRSAGESFVGHLCVIEYPNRDQLAASLKELGIASDVHYPILDPDQPAWREMESRSGDLSVSRAMGSRILTLPLFPEMTDQEHRQVCDGVRTVLRQSEKVQASVQVESKPIDTGVRS